MGRFRMAVVWVYGSEFASYRFFCCSGDCFDYCVQYRFRRGLSGGVIEGWVR
jgi:hypothetical protein